MYCFPSFQTLSDFESRLKYITDVVKVRKKNFISLLLQKCYIIFVYLSFIYLHLHGSNGISHSLTPLIKDILMISTLMLASQHSRPSPLILKRCKPWTLTTQFQLCIIASITWRQVFIAKLCQLFFIVLIIQLHDLIS